MRAVVQRVAWGRVRVAGEIIGSIDAGVVVLLGVGHGDTAEHAALLARKIAELRIFQDDQGKMNHSLLDVEGQALVVSQFTLYADCKRGRRPFFGQAAAPEPAAALCERFAEGLRVHGVAHVATGRFGAHMEVELCNDGPVTIMLDTDAL